MNITLTQVRGYDADIIGATVTVTDLDTSTTLLSTTWQGNAITLDIEAVTNYKVEVGSVVGYITPSSQQYISKPSRELNITFQYSALGVFIEATDGSLYTSSSWASGGKTANCVVLLTDNVRLRISLVHKQAPIHSNYNDALSTYISKPSNINTYYNGKNDTDKIIQFNKAYGTNNTNYAAPYCKNYTFPDGVTKGYMPSTGQLYEIGLNKTAIDQCISACGGTAIITGEKGSRPGTPEPYVWWSSTYNTRVSNIYEEVYWIWWNNTNLGSNGIDLDRAWARAVADYE